MNVYGSIKERVYEGSAGKEGNTWNSIINTIISMYHFSMKPFIAFCFHSIIKNLIFTIQTLITLFDHDVDAFSAFCGCMFANRAVTSEFYEI